MDEWKITYEIHPVSDIQPFEGYPSLGIRFRVDAGTLVEIEHRLDVPEGGDALRMSHPKILALLELLEFLWRTSTRITIKGATPTPVV